MKGSFFFKVKSKKVVFEFTIRRNITVIKGDSASGKTTLLHMLYEYLRVGRESGYSVSTDSNYYVYLRPEVGRDWRDALLPLENTVIFIEENNHFVFSQEFAAFVQESGNYFVLVNRSPLKMLPYSIHEIYEIVTVKKHADVRESYHKLQELYSNYPIPENNRLRQVITEDSHSGYQFFSRLFSSSHVISANGNSNILRTVAELPLKDTLVIADGAAFGALMEDCLESFESKTCQRIALWLPESFEYLILKSGLVPLEGLGQILESTSNYVESQRFESWERFFCQLLITATEDTQHPYSKEMLHPYYLTDKNLNAIAAQLPDPINPR